MTKITLAILAFLMILTMQNCGNGSFHSGTQLRSLATEGLAVLRVSNPSGSSVLVDVKANDQLFVGSTSILWDHTFNEDLVYCEQTTTANKTVTTFLCPGEGVLTVFLYVEYSNGAQITKKVRFNLSPTGNSPLGPISELTGAELYTLYCSGCHGAINSTPKRGLTLPRLNSALSSVPLMSSLNNILTTDDKSAIVKALK